MAGYGRCASAASAGTSAASQLVADEGFAVFYATPETVARLSGVARYTMLAMRLRDASRGAAERTAAAGPRRAALRPGLHRLRGLPRDPQPGDYPGKALFEQIARSCRSITILALLSALVLLSNTMSTLIGEQTSEIAAMKAIGATRRQIARIYRRTALLLGVARRGGGRPAGRRCCRTPSRRTSRPRSTGSTPSFQFDGAILVVSVARRAGRPAARGDRPRSAERRACRCARRSTQAARRSVARGASTPCCAGCGSCRAARRSACAEWRDAGGGPPRPPSRSALAVGTLLALLALGTSVGDMTRAFFDDARWDVWATTYASKPFTPDGERRIKTLPGVAEAQPMLTNGTRIAGSRTYSFGLAPRPMYEPDAVAGRWYTAAEARAGARVAVIGSAVADSAGVGVGRHDAGADRRRPRPRAHRRGHDERGLPGSGRLPAAPHAAVDARTPGEVNNYLDPHRVTGPRSDRPDHHAPRGHPRRAWQPAHDAGQLRQPA